MAGGQTGLENTGTHKAIGITLAILSSAFIGSSFVLKKKGLLQTNALGHEAGKGHAYLKNAMWWTGLILMGLGEGLNFVSLSFAQAILVVPLGALSVVLAAILSSLFLNERLDFSGKIGCAHCILGAVLIVLNGPEGTTVHSAIEFFDYAIESSFIIYTSIVGAFLIYLVNVIAPTYGDQQPIVYISICSIVGSYLVVTAQGIGSSIVYSINNWDTDNQFTKYQFYMLFIFMICSLISQIHYLNKALNLFSTAIVTPVYYVFFTTATIITSAVLFKGFPVKDPLYIVNSVLGFLVIVGGVALLFNYNLKLKHEASIKRKNEDDMMKNRNARNLEIIDTVELSPVSTQKKSAASPHIDSADTLGYFNEKMLEELANSSAIGSPKLETPVNIQIMPHRDEKKEDLDV